MEKNNVVELVQPREFSDQLIEILRQGAHTLVLQAVKAEFVTFLEKAIPIRSWRVDARGLSGMDTCRRGRS